MKCFRSIVLSSVLIFFPIQAYALDFLEFSKNTLLHCLHPTADGGDVRGIYYIEDITEREDGTSDAVIGMSYTGWFLDHDLKAKIMYNNNDRKIKVNVIEDSNSYSNDCKYIKSGWH